MEKIPWNEEDAGDPFCLWVSRTGIKPGTLIRCKHPTKLKSIHDGNNVQVHANQIIMYQGYAIKADTIPGPSWGWPALQFLVVTKGTERPLYAQFIPSNLDETWTERYLSGSFETEERKVKNPFWIFEDIDQAFQQTENGE